MGWSTAGARFKYRVTHKDEIQPGKWYVVVRVDPREISSHGLFNQVGRGASYEKAVQNAISEANKTLGI